LTVQFSLLVPQVPLEALGVVRLTCARGRSGSGSQPSRRARSRPLVLDAPAAGWAPSCASVGACLPLQAFSSQGPAGQVGDIGVPWLGKGGRQSGDRVGPPPPQLTPGSKSEILSWWRHRRCQYGSVGQAGLRDRPDSRGGGARSHPDRSSNQAPSADTGYRREFLGNGAAKESNLPSVGLPRPAGFEDLWR
jgi:hypothetical protein